MPRLRPLPHTLLGLILAAAPAALHADSVPVRFPQGSAHAFLTLSTLDGKHLASGDFSQTEHAGRLNARLVFHFRDGSVDDEVTTFTQNGAFHLLRDHHIQRGPSFPHPIDMLIDVPTGHVQCTTLDAGGNPRVTDLHLDLPPDLSNGLALPILMNIRPSTPVTQLPLIAPGEKPRLIHLSIRPTGNDPFFTGGSRHEATHFVAKVEIGGLAGIVAPILGKQPEDVHIWIYEGDSPAFVKEEGQLYEGGPIWRAEISSVIWPRSSTIR